MGKFSNVAHYQDFTELKKILSASAANTYDMDKIEKAYKFAEKAHGDQRRVSGIPYILHPVSVACIVAELGMDTDSVCGALLHDTVEDTGVTLEEVTKLFGADVAKLIDGVTKISKIILPSSSPALFSSILLFYILHCPPIYRPMSATAQRFSHFFCLKLP